MGKHTIKDESGKPERGDNGGRLTWSDKDGDSPQDKQTVYEESSKIGVGSTKTDHTYNPDTGKLSR